MITVSGSNDQLLKDSTCIQRLLGKIAKRLLGLLVVITVVAVELGVQLYLGR